MAFSKNRFCILLEDALVPLAILPGQLTRHQMTEEGWRLVREDSIPPTTPTSMAPTGNLTQPVLSEKTMYLPPDHHVRRPKVTADHLSQLIQGIQHVQTERTIQHPTSSTTSQRSASVTSFTPSDCPKHPKGLVYHGAPNPNPSGIKPDPSKKEYCTHWLMRGECAYTQQGCRFKHQMPDVKKLREIGFREVPRWYIEKTRIIPGQLSWRRQDVNQDNSERQLSTEPSASCAFRPPVLVKPLRDLSEGKVISTASEDIEPDLKIENLIDLSDSIPSTPLLTSGMLISSLLSTTPCNVTVDSASLSNQHLSTLASSLRKGEVKMKGGIPQAKENPEPVATSSSTSRITTHSDTLLSITAHTNPLAQTLNALTGSPAIVPSISESIIDLSSEHAPHALASRPFSREETNRIRNGAIEAKIMTPPSTHLSKASSDKKNVRSPKPQKKRAPRPQKPADWSATPGPQDDLITSQQVTGSKPRGLNSSSKGGRRRGTGGSGMDLQSQITLRTRAGYDKEKSSKGSKRAGDHARPMQAVTSTKAQSTLDPKAI